MESPAESLGAKHGSNVDRRRGRMRVLLQHNTVVGQSNLHLAYKIVYAIYRQALDSPTNNSSMQFVLTTDAATGGGEKEVIGRV